MDRWDWHGLVAVAFWLLLLALAIAWAGSELKLW